MTDCVFCKIVRNEAPAQVVQRWADAIAIIPLNPVCVGHVLVIPHAHVTSASTDPAVTAAAMHRAAEYGQRIGDHNVIANVGPGAGQTVWHLHIHVVPRLPADGLVMPWDRGKAEHKWMMQFAEWWTEVCTHLGRDPVLDRAVDDISDLVAVLKAAEQQVGFPPHSIGVDDRVRFLVNEVLRLRAAEKP